MPGENLPRRVWNRQTKFTYNHWLAALVKGKCTSTKPTRIATGVVSYPDTEQNWPYKIPWSCRGLNQGPPAPQARTLPVCHTTPQLLSVYNTGRYSCCGQSPFISVFYTGALSEMWCTGMCGPEDTPHPFTPSFCKTFPPSPNFQFSKTHFQPKITNF